MIRCDEGTPSSQKSGTWRRVFLCERANETVRSIRPGLSTRLCIDFVNYIGYIGRTVKPESL